MNAARIDRSPRLQRTLAALRSAGASGLTTLELFNWTGSMAVHSDVAEIRENGIAVECQPDGKTDSGRRVYRYRLIEERAA